MRRPLHGGTTGCQLLLVFRRRTRYLAIVARAGVDREMVAFGNDQAAKARDLTWQLEPN